MPFMRRGYRNDYVHRGDRARRRQRIKRRLLLVGLAASVYAVTHVRQQEASASGLAATGREMSATELRNALDSATGELNLAKAQLDRVSRIMEYSTRYKVAGDLARDIYDIALAEGIEPELAFRLVRLESDFNERATSPVGAVGLTQLMLPTAQYFQKGITREKLYGREVNLRIGFRYLRALIRENKGNTNLALLVYNRGPAAVQKARKAGVNPSNGYDRIIMKGYQGRTTVD
jgi:soluble lytic murein transglycosylase-like protein